MTFMFNFKNNEIAHFFIVCIESPLSIEEESSDLKRTVAGAVDIVFLDSILRIK